ncbi:MAG: putative oxidoreductase [Anaerolineales bacterium]|nr:putative oxidoreductase [Anaerolineales bacterium]WKZ47112.1 MAG: SDR family NAD(P)-dependent oxidoreductase [Anaerolineales bacterium]
MTQNNNRKRAVIVGASSGIGAELARKLADEGYRLMLLARRDGNLKALCDRINSEVGEMRAQYVVHNVADYQRIPQIFNQVVDFLGGLDLIVYNSGVLIPVGAQEYDFSKDLETMQINILGAMAWLNPAADYFQKQGAGQIVGISSVGGERGRTGAPAYNTSKAALNAYLESLRNRLSRRGVNVLTVKPGFISTDMIQNAKTSFWVAPVNAAVADIWKGIRDRKQDAYTPARWRIVGWVMRNAPSFLMRRLAV